MEDKAWGAGTTSTSSQLNEAKEKQLTISTERLSRLSDELTEMITRLETKLVPVLNPQPKVDRAEEGKSEVMSPMAQQIHDCCDVISRNIKRISELEDELDL